MERGCVAVWVSLAVAFGLPGHVCGHPCVRPCDGQLMTCEYNFTVEWYLTLSKACWDCPFNLTDCSRPHCLAADGHRRSVITINRQLPGPAIEVCEGDSVVVWVSNKLSDGATTSIHWHGLHQRGTPYMDGTAHITQCPIQPLETFRYQFTASPAGTHWYHSHSGVQFGDGCFGPIIVRQKGSADPHSSLFDKDQSDHVLVISDWEPTTTHDRFMHLMHDAYVWSPMSALINGRARMFPVVDIYNVTGSPESSATTPMSVFKVEASKRYRFRLISTAQKCPFWVFFRHHQLKVV